MSTLKTDNIESLDTGRVIEVDSLTDRQDLANRVIRVTSIAEMEAYSAPVGYVFSLNAGGRSGTFDVIAGDFSTELAADTLNGIYIGLADDPTAATKVAVRTDIGFVAPEFFGAVGDGVVNDNAAFVAMSLYVEANDGGNIVLSNKTYLIGGQDKSTDPNTPEKMVGRPVISVSNTKQVIIKGNGATLLVESFNKVGSFDPITGEAYYPGGYFTDHDYKNSSNNVIILDDNDFTEVENLEIDGRQSTVVLGGIWGDTGYQVGGNGLGIYHSKRTRVSNVYTHDNVKDGMYIDEDTPDATRGYRSIFLSGVNSILNGRQGFSLVGGGNLVAINCRFNESGQGKVSSSPKSGMDIEGSPISNLRFINCEFKGNAHAQFVSNYADADNIKFDQCSFISGPNGGNAIWCNAPTNVKFVDCYISGAIVRIRPTLENGVKFVGCTISDKYYEGGSNYMIDPNNPIILDTCDIVITKEHPIWYNPVTFHECNFFINIDVSTIDPALTNVKLGTNGSIRGCTIYENITNNGVGVTFSIDGDLATKGWSNKLISLSGGDYFPLDTTPDGFAIPDDSFKSKDLELSARNNLLTINDTRTLGFMRTDQGSEAGGDVKVGDVFFYSSGGDGSSSGLKCTVAGAIGSTAVLRDLSTISSTGGW